MCGRAIAYPHFFVGIEKRTEAERDNPLLFYPSKFLDLPPPLRKCFYDSKTKRTNGPYQTTKFVDKIILAKNGVFTPLRYVLQYYCICNAAVHHIILTKNEKLIPNFKMIRVCFDEKTNNK